MLISKCVLQHYAMKTHNVDKDVLIYRTLLLMSGGRKVYGTSMVGLFFLNHYKDNACKDLSKQYFCNDKSHDVYEREQIPRAVEGCTFQRRHPVLTVAPVVILEYHCQG